MTASFLGAPARSASTIFSRDAIVAGMTAGQHADERAEAEADRRRCRC